MATERSHPVLEHRDGDANPAAGAHDSATGTRDGEDAQGVPSPTGARTAGESAGAPAFALQCLRCGKPLVGGAAFCHHCGAGSASRASKGWLYCGERNFLLLGLFSGLACWLLIWLEVETVLVTAPILTVVGLLLVIAAAMHRHLLGILAGASHIAVCMLCVALVNTCHWGPRESTEPFLAIGGVYLLLSAVLSWRALQTRPVPRADDSRCAKCGYMLCGLPEPRCPECGTPFDPALVPPLHQMIG